MFTAVKLDGRSSRRFCWGCFMRNEIGRDRIRILLGRVGWLEMEVGRGQSAQYNVLSFIWGCFRGSRWMSDGAKVRHIMYWASPEDGLEIRCQADYTSGFQMCMF